MISTLLVCLVVGISDGDTLTARCGLLDQHRQVRIHAIDAPERNQPFGQKSQQSLARLCRLAVARIQPQDIDHFGRTVGQVECRGRDAATHQVSRGMAWASTRYRRADLAGLEARARAARKGLWADTDPAPPWEWRRQHPRNP